MTRPRILIAESSQFAEAALARLREVAHVIPADLDRAGLLAAVTDVDALWVRLRHQIDDEVFQAAGQLRVVATPTTGLNHIDLAAAQRRGIQVFSLRGETDFLKDVRATAELTVGLILALLRQLPAATTHATRGGWDRDLFVGTELYGKTIGIVGYGRLGQLVARYFKAFDARILVSDPGIGRDEVTDEVHVVSLLPLLKQADVVTLHVNLYDGTRGFFGAQQFAAMRHGARFVNTSRGELVDEAALLETLQNGHLAGAAVDVLSGEDAAGMEAHPLVRYAQQHSNLIITPHIGGCTAESRAKTETFLAEKLCAVLRQYSVPSLIAHS